MGSAATAAGAPDFAQADVFATGGTLGVVMELDGNPPFRTIPAGSSNTIAVYEYSASETGCPDRGPQAFDLTFSDNVLGDPVKENVIVIGGRSRNPELNNGTLTINITTNPSISTPLDTPANGIVELTWQVDSGGTWVDGSAPGGPWNYAGTGQNWNLSWKFTGAFKGRVCMQLKAQGYSGCWVVAY